MSVRTPLGSYRASPTSADPAAEEAFVASIFRSVAEDSGAAEELRQAREAFTDAEWRALRASGVPAPDIVWLSGRDVHARRRFLGVVGLTEGQVGELEAAGLVAAGQRRTKAEMAHFRLTLYEILRAHRPMTVRQAFYQMVTRGLPKLETEYARVQQELVKMRRGEAFPQVPYGWIADSTRWMRKPTTYGSLDAALEETARTYRRDLWRNQPDYVEVWLEKDALAGVLVDVTAEFDVPLMVSRGFSSVSFLYEAAESIRDVGKPAHIYIFTDRDRSGDDIASAIGRTLHELAPQADIRTHRAAVTEGQVETLGLPTRPPKRKGDPPAVELDAIPPDELRRIARGCIERHIDPDVLERTRAIEREERNTLRDVARSLDGRAA